MVLGTLALLVMIFTMNHIDIGFITGFPNAFIALAVLIFALFGLNLRRNAVLPWHAPTKDTTSYIRVKDSLASGTSQGKP